ncbi:unnamed protein product [Amoebophrya sp. A120]|nr:unnamed protein product [Amoebophrya sp. A120]|eukprot:GSA120T00011842001.1
MAPLLEKQDAARCPVMSGQMQAPEGVHLPPLSHFDGAGVNGDPSDGACPFLKVLQERGEPLPAGITFQPDPYWANVQRDMDRETAKEKDGGMTLGECFTGIFNGAILKQLCAGGTTSSPSTAAITGTAAPAPAQSDDGCSKGCCGDKQ